MREVYLDMDSVSDASEVYASKPHPFFRVFVYVLLALLMAALAWSSFFEVENTVNCPGVVEKTGDSVTVANRVDGYVKSVSVEDDDVVHVGDVLYELDSAKIEEGIAQYEKAANDYDNRLAVLQEYLRVLRGEVASIDAVQGNPYHDEYANRLRLLNVSNDQTAAQSSRDQSSISASIEGYNSSIERNNATLGRLERLEDAIVSRENPFGLEDPYYYNTAQSFIESYGRTRSEYDEQITSARESGADTASIQELERQRDSALDAMTAEALASVQKEIETLEGSNLTLRDNIDAANASRDDTGSMTLEKIRLTEADSVYGEIETLKRQLEENDSNLRALRDNLDDTVVRAIADGAVNLRTELAKGDAVSAGQQVLDIVPTDENRYRITAYVDSSKVGKVREGMVARSEVSSYPKSDYGTFDGTVTSISENIKVSDDSIGVGYYIAEISLDGIPRANKAGEVAKFQEGMSVDVRVVTGRESVLSYLLKRVRLVD